MTTLTAPEVEAAEAEGLLAISKEQKAKLQRYRALKARKEAIESEMSDLRDAFLKDLEDEHGQGLLLNGKVVVRRSAVMTPRLNAKELKKKHPEIANEFVIVTESVRLTVI